VRHRRPRHRPRCATHVRGRGVTRHHVAVKVHLERVDLRGQGRPSGGWRQRGCRGTSRRWLRFLRAAVMHAPPQPLDESTDGRRARCKCPEAVTGGRGASVQCEGAPHTQPAAPASEQRCSAARCGKRCVEHGRRRLFPPLTPENKSEAMAAAAAVCVDRPQVISERRAEEPRHGARRAHRPGPLAQSQASTTTCSCPRRKHPPRRNLSP
jgi:hypothetical protein